MKTTRTKGLVSIALVLGILLSFSGVGMAASDEIPLPSLPEQNTVSEDDTSGNEIAPMPIDIQLDMNDIEQYLIDKPSGGISPMSVWDTSGVSIGATSGTLTDSNPWDLYLFSTDTPLQSYARVLSTNSDYKVRLILVDNEWTMYYYDNDSAYVGNELNHSIVANNATYIYYGYLVQSDGTVGEDYTLEWDYSSPAGTKRAFVSDQYAANISVGADGIYLNGQKVNNIVDGAMDGSWQREKKWNRTWKFEGNTYGGYEKHVCNVSCIKVKKTSNGLPKITHVMENYSNAVYTSPLVYFLELDIDTLYSRSHSIWNPAPNGGMQYETYDYRGNDTPIRLTAYHVTEDHHYLVVDAGTGTIIDVYGDLNYLYTHGVDARPTCTVASGRLFSY